MNILFLALGKYSSINDRGIYLDLLRVFIRNGHNVYIVTSLPQNIKGSHQLIEEPSSHLLRVKIGRITNVSIIEKGINTLLIEKRYIRAIKKVFSNVRYDLILYPTPPITFNKVVEYIKKRDGAKSYLLLKDIFPQNAVDLGMMSKTGIKGIIYRYFRDKERRLYEVSDHIGCMSQANVDYVLKHNPEADPAKVEICPNSTDIEDKSVDEEARARIREKYGIPKDKKVFIYGGNLGKPQGIPFLIECLKAVKDIDEAYFLVVGNGTEYGKLKAFSESSKQANFKLMQRLPKEDYDSMVGACDVGMIFLDHRFTIPNFPSRLLSYMSAKLPVLAVTDPSTDVGKVIEEGGFGWWCESNNAENFVNVVEEAVKTDTRDMAGTEFQFLIDNYSSDKTYRIICDSLKWE